MSHSPARSTIDVGSVIAGTYTIEAMIGRGGMGAVFLASHTRLPGKQVAIKVLHAELGGDEIEARFKREAQIASMLSHPNIVHIEDYNVTADGMPYLVLEYLQGESLAQRIKRAGPLTIDQTVSILRQVGSALAAAHAKGIVHRDLKPQNIFVVPTEIDGRSRDLAKVLDFGISKIRDSQTVKTQDNALLGTPQYMAPEQATGQHDKVDERTDIFALGAIVYEMLSGTPAFSGQTIPEVVFKVVYEQPVDLGTRAPTVSDAIKETVHRAMSKAPEDRFATVSAFVEALTGSPVSVMRVASPPASSTGPASAAAAAFDGTGPTSASGKAPITNREALAETVGSGDHAAALASTAASEPGARAAVPPSPSAATPSPSPASPSPSAASPSPSSSSAKSRAPLLVGALLAAAAAIGGIVWATRGSSSSQTRPSSVAAGAPATTTVPATTTAPATTTGAQPAPSTTAGTESAQTSAAATAGSDAPHAADAPATAGSAAPHAANAAAATANAQTPAPKTPSSPSSPTKPATSPTPAKPKPPVLADDDEAASGGDSLVSVQLENARQHIEKSEWAAASTALDKAMGDKDARPLQLDQVRSLRGVIACNRNDTEVAKSVLNALVRRPKMRQRVLEACHQNGWFEEIKR